MITAVARDMDNKPVVIIGLSEENIKRIRADEPILVDGDKFGFEGKISIFGGRGTEDDLAARLKEIFFVEDVERQ